MRPCRMVSSSTTRTMRFGVVRGLVPTPRKFLVGEATFLALMSTGDFTLTAPGAETLRCTLSIPPRCRCFLSPAVLDVCSWDTLRLLGDGSVGRLTQILWLFNGWERDGGERDEERRRFGVLPITCCDRNSPQRGETLRIGEASRCFLWCCQA